jgi:hypothetical protein
MNRYWLINNDKIIRMDSVDKDSVEYKYLTSNGWKFKKEELICSDDEMYKFLDKNGPSDMETIKKAFPNYRDEELRYALSSLVYTARTVEPMNGLGTLGVFVTAKHQKSWNNKILKYREDKKKQVSLPDLPNPDVEPISTCDNKTKIIDLSTAKSDKTAKESTEEHVEKEIKATISLTKVAQKELRKNIIEKATKENLYGFDTYIISLGVESVCYWNEYLDNFKRKLILTEIKKKST